MDSAVEEWNDVTSKPVGVDAVGRQLERNQSFAF